MSEKEIPAGKM